MTKEERNELHSEVHLVVFLAFLAVLAVLWCMKRGVFAVFPWQHLVQPAGIYENGVQPRIPQPDAAPQSLTDLPQSSYAAGGLRPEDELPAATREYDFNPANRGTPPGQYATSGRGQIIPSNPLSVAAEALQLLNMGYQNDLYSEGK